MNQINIPRLLKKVNQRVQLFENCRVAYSRRCPNRNHFELKLQDQLCRYAVGYGYDFVSANLFDDDDTRIDQKNLTELIESRLFYFPKQRSTNEVLQYLEDKDRHLVLLAFGVNQYDESLGNEIQHLLSSDNVVGVETILE